MPEASDKHRLQQICLSEKLGALLNLLNLQNVDHLKISFIVFLLIF